MSSVAFLLPWQGTARMCPEMAFPPQGNTTLAISSPVKGRLAQGRNRQAWHQPGMWHPAQLWWSGRGVLTAGLHARNREGSGTPLLVSSQAVMAEVVWRPSMAIVSEALQPGTFTCCFWALGTDRTWGRTATALPAPGHPARISLAGYLGPDKRSSPGSEGNPNGRKEVHPV